MHGADVALRFNATTGALEQLAFDGRALLARGPRLSLWRAPTDNDGVRLHSRVGGVLPKWQRWNLAAPRSRVDAGPHSTARRPVRSSWSER